MAQININTASAALYAQNGVLPNYNECPSTVFDHVASFLKGFVVMFFTLHIFYRLPLVSIIGGLLCGAAYIFLAAQSATTKRKLMLRTQFFDMLEALSVAMRAGNSTINAFRSAREDLLLLYAQGSDIISEMTAVIRAFETNIPLSVSLKDFAQRSGLEDVESFASIYKTIEGKAGRMDEIVRQTQEIISDKMAIEMEIDTLMTAAKSEVNIMLAMPLVILGIIGYMGEGFMDAIYTTTIGRIVATAGVVVLIISFLLARKFSNVKL